MSKVDRRRQILLVAKELIAEKPFQKLRYTEIANQLNVDSKLIHYYFKSKESLLLGLFDLYLEEYAQLTSELEHQRNCSAFAALSLVRHNVRNHLPIMRTIMELALNNQLGQSFIKTNDTWRLNETLRRVLNLTSTDQDDILDSNLLLVVIFFTIVNCEVFSDYIENFFGFTMSDENSDRLLLLLAKASESMAENKNDV